MVDVARYEAGDLGTARAIEVQFHFRQCPRCGSSLADIRQARHEILGLTASSQAIRARTAAEEIRKSMRCRLQLH